MRSRVLVFSCAVGLLLASVSMNPLAWVLSIVAIVIYVSLHFKLGEFPIALMAFAIPALEIVTSLVNVELSGLTLKEGFGNGGKTAYVLSILAFVSFMVGFQLFRKKEVFRETNGVKEALAGITMERLVVAHLLLTALAFVLRGFFGYGSAFFQLVVHFEKFPLLVLYLIGWKFLVEKRDKGLVAVVFGFNLVIRLTGFFSEWKELLFLLVFVILGASEKLSAGVVRRLSAIFAVGVMFVLTWQGVKMEYRQFLNGGRNSQAVVVGNSEAIGKFVELTRGFWMNDETTDDKGDIVQSTLDRLGYLEFFARTVDRVPGHIDHENGQLLSDNLTFALVPRILNPNKGVKNDQAKVEYYANRPVSDHSSFSLGRYAEWYVDFGGFGMMVFAFLVGGLGSRIPSLIPRSENAAMSLVDAAFVMLTFQLWMSYQADEIKIYGQTLWGTLLFLTFGRRLISSTLGIR